jgi:hypothetical protein
LEERILATPSQRNRQSLVGLRPGIAWFEAEVWPRLRLVEDLDGLRRSASPRFSIAGLPITGGPHWLVEWSDGSTRAVYALCVTGLSASATEALVALLQLWAIEVLHRRPEDVVVLYLRRQQVLSGRPLDFGMAARIRDVCRRLRELPPAA